MNDFPVFQKNELSREKVERALQKTYEFARLMSYYRCAMAENILAHKLR